MSKRIIIPESAIGTLKKKCNKKQVPPYEADEFYIGSDSGGPSMYYHITENTETEVKSDEVDLSSFRKQKRLAPKIWDKGQLNSKVRLKLLDVADDFWKSLEIDWVKREDTLLMGSICNYNWSEYSDIDLHLLVDFTQVDEKVDFVRNYFDAKKNEWNERHGENLKIYGFPIEVYVQDINDENASNAVYSLDKNKWLKPPHENQIESIGLEKYQIKDLAAKIMTKIDDLVDAFDDTDDIHQIEEIDRWAEKLFKSIKNMRKRSLEKKGEMSIGNLVFKVLRRTEYMGKLIDLRNATYDVLNSVK